MKKSTVTKVISLVLGLTMVFSVQTTVFGMETTDALPAPTSTELTAVYNEENYEQEFMPGEVLVGMNYSVASGYGLKSASDAVSLFSGIEITGAEDLHQSAEEAAAEVLAEEDMLVKTADNGEDSRTVYLLTLADQSRESVLDAIEVLKENPDVAYAEPNYIFTLDEDANDPYYGNLWGMDKIQAPEAWDLATGEASVKIGVMDTGFDYTHPDLDDNIDRNLGYYVAQNTYGLNADIMDYDSHGTHVAGTIGAEGNNAAGVAGVNWDVTIAPIKIAISNSDTSSNTSLMAKALLYADELGLPITSMSYSLSYSTTLINAVREYGGLFTVAAGNAGANNDNNTGYSALHALGNVIFVANSTSSDVLSGSSSYGVNTVALAAPGSSIYSTILGGRYGYKTGTSMAAPHVAGAAGLILSYRPDLTTQELKAAILENVDDVPALNGQVSTGGRLNVFKALESLKITPTHPTQIVAGKNHSLVLTEDGTVWAFGRNTYGQLGIGSSADQSTPTQITDLSDIIAVAAGAAHTLALKEDGTVWAFGGNGNGQLGIGSRVDQTTPVQIPGLTDIKAIAAGAHHSLVLKEDGTVWAFGYNGSWQLGIGFTPQAEQITPVQIANLNDIKAIAAGNRYSLFLNEDGTVWTCGDNPLDLGLGKPEPQHTPIQIPGLSGVKALAAGGEHSLALKEDGTVWAFGSNYHGKLGLGLGIPHQITPELIYGLAGVKVKAISAGTAHSLALAEDGTVWAFGENGYGQLGIDSPDNQFYPTQISGFDGVKAIAVGDYHSIALKEDGTIWSFGNNTYSQLGDGTGTDRREPAQVLPFE